MDVAFRNVGVAIWDSRLAAFTKVYVISTERDNEQSRADDNKACVEFIAERIHRLFQDPKIDYVLAELPVGSSRSSSAAHGLGLAFATIVAVSAVNNIDLRPVKPSAIKRWASPGTSKVDKQAVIRKVMRVFNPSANLFGGLRDGLLEHAADAMACLGAYKKLQ